MPVSTTSGDRTPELQEALWSAARAFGVDLEVHEQVAVARRLAAVPANAMTVDVVQQAFSAAGLGAPSTRFAKRIVQIAGATVDRLSIRDVLLDYRRFAIENLSAQFGGKTHGDEEGLRNNLLTYLPQHGYTEARTGRGRTDIVIPPPEDALIEVKVWESQSYYEDGLEEVRRYIHTHSPRQACIVVFGDRDPLPRIIANHTQAIAEEPELEGITVPVIVVPFEVDAPSKARRNERKRRKDRGDGS
jgi:hypothetical protein